MGRPPRASLKAVVNRTPWARAALALPIAVRRQVLTALERRAEQVVDTLSGLIEGDAVFRLEAFGGDFAVGPKSDIFRRLALTGRYEPELAACFRRHLDPEHDVIDVGANLGFFSVLGATLLRQGRVLAVEPSGSAVERLRGNLARNGVEGRVIVFHGLASDRRGEAALNVVPGKEEYASMGALTHPAIRGQASTAETLPTATLDDLVAEHGLRPALIKIDVEGAEGLVLKGAVETLKTFRPVVISELSDPLLGAASGVSARDLVAMMEALAYVVTDPITGGKAARTAFGDMLCVPREQTLT